MNKWRQPEESLGGFWWCGTFSVANFTQRDLQEPAGEHCSQATDASITSNVRMTIWKTVVSNTISLDLTKVASFMVRVDNSMWHMERMLWEDELQNRKIWMTGVVWIGCVTQNRKPAREAWREQTGQCDWAGRRWACTAAPCAFITSLQACTSFLSFLADAQNYTF